MLIKNHKMLEVKVGNVYHWDTKKFLRLERAGTKHVKVLKLRHGVGPLLDLISIETKEVITADIMYVQPDPEILKRKFVTMKRYFKKHNPDRIFYYAHSDTKEYVIIGYRACSDKVVCLDKYGILHSFARMWFDGCTFEG